jgi:methyl-accepting chemotaxis protein
MTVERWNDGMLDEFASSVTELRESTTELRESTTELRESTTELRESVTEVKDGIDGLRITAQALLQLAAQSQRDMELIKERQAESDQRFNVLLEEVRFLIRGNKAN